MIALTGSIPVYDPRLETLLNPDGRLFVVVGSGPAQTALLVTRLASGERREQSLFETELDALDRAPSPSPFYF